MKRFDTFGEYMTDLLFGPLKKGTRAVNQFHIFFKVVGREFDDIKRVIFQVRAEANVASASEVMLRVHGQDRDMPRLKGESLEAYRTRLSMKGLVAEWGGTRQGILYSLTALGYEMSYIEPFSLTDASRWAEFIVFLKGSRQSSINNLTVIDAEVRKVKEGSSKPSYGAEDGGIIEITSDVQTGFSRYPRCGETVCGIWPHVENIGYLVISTVKISGGADSGLVRFPKVGTIAASKKFFQPCDFIMYEGIASDIVASSQNSSGSKVYTRCSTVTYCSPSTTREGGKS